MDWLLWIVLGALFIGAMPILIVSAICLIALIAERVEEKREERRQREKGMKQ